MLSSTWFFDLYVQLHSVLTYDWIIFEGAHEIFISIFGDFIFNLSQNVPRKYQICTSNRNSTRGIFETPMCCKIYVNDIPNQRSPPPPQTFLYEKVWTLPENFRYERIFQHSFKRSQTQLATQTTTRRWLPHPAQPTRQHIHGDQRRINSRKRRRNCFRWRKVRERRGVQSGNARRVNGAQAEPAND